MWRRERRGPKWTEISEARLLILKERCQPQPLCGKTVERSMVYGPKTQTSTQNFLSTHHKIVLLSACPAISQKDPLRPEDPRKQKRLSNVSSCLRSVHDSRAPNWCQGCLPLFPELYLFPKQIHSKPLQNCSPFFHLTTMKTASNSLNC